MGGNLERWGNTLMTLRADDGVMMHCAFVVTQVPGLDLGVYRVGKARGIWSLGDMIEIDKSCPSARSRKRYALPFWYRGTRDNALGGWSLLYVNKRGGNDIRGQFM